MKGNRKELVMKFIHEYSNIKCDKIKEFDNLKNKGLEGLSNWEKVIVRMAFFCSIQINNLLNPTSTTF